MFGRAAITLGIGPHSSFVWILPYNLLYDFFCNVDLTPILLSNVPLALDLLYTACCTANPRQIAQVEDSRDILPSRRAT